MTNLFSSSQKPKIVFIHGLNNNRGCFDALTRLFQEKGFKTELIILPCHGEDRKEASDFKTALRIFDQKMKDLKNTPYYVIAFSTGALYLQLWLEKNPENKPLKQVLLAPALYLRRQNLIEKMVTILPPFFKFKSFSPKAFRRYELMNVWEYKILIEGVKTYQKIRPTFKVPTLVMIDKKDELVDAEAISKNLPHVELLERLHLKGLGSHHIIFHPEYFQKESWESFFKKLSQFLSSD
jgi:alpha-beta hydrolase superfamily lysophospholipase